MSRNVLPNVMVGNDFLVPRPKISAPVVTPTPVIATPTVVSLPMDMDLPQVSASATAWPKRLFNLMHRYSLGAFALLFLLVGSSAIQVASLYQSAHIALTTNTVSKVAHDFARPTVGLNTVVQTSKLTTTVQQITSQPISLVSSDKTITIPADQINSWLKIVTDSKKGVSYIHVEDQLINPALVAATAPLVKTPVDQVTIKHADGTSLQVNVGQNGAKMGDTSGLAKQISRNLLGAKGMQLNLPLETVPFQAVGSESFDKLLEVNVTTKQMYAYEKGQQVNSWPISAGAAATPTPLGQYKIYEKLAVQDMRGYNANGTKYFQPHVRWINYFLPGGYAVHGNYWRPLSWFGAINSSHGCVSLPDDQAKWVYDWAPIGTTVITHA